MARHLGPARFLVLAILALLVVGALPAAAQDPVRDQLVEALLTADDLPDGFTSDEGIIDGSNFNIDRASFDANNGLGIVSQVWNRVSPSGPVVVFDFRMLFPTPEDARNYLRDAEPIISERDASGLKKDKNEPPIGDLHRLYSGTNSISGQKIAFNNHLLTVGSMAAKVFVSGAPGSAAAARSIAEAAARNMGDAQIGAPITTPAPDPSADPGPDLAGVFAAILQSHVGPGAGTCTLVDAPAFAGELAGIVCPIGTKDEVVVYRLMDSVESLQAAFVPFRGDITGPAGSCKEAASREPRTIDGVQVGELACYTTADPSRVFIWTDEPLKTIAWIVGTDKRAFKALYALYETAGPVPGATDLPTTSPGPAPTPEVAATPEPTLQPGLSDAQAALALHVPPKIRGTCGPTAINVAASATAAVLCTATVADGTISVTYQQFDAQDAMDSVYADNLEFLGAERGSGPCSGEWPAEGDWTVNDEPGGRVACAEVGGISKDMAWTDDRLLILGLAETFTATKETMHQWWLDESGPIG